MSDLERLTELKAKLGKLQQQRDKSQGVLDRVLSELQEEFACDSLEAAEALLKTVEGKRDEAEGKFKKAMRMFEKRWKGKLDG